MSNDLHKVMRPAPKEKATVAARSALLSAVSLLTVSLGVSWTEAARGAESGSHHKVGDINWQSNQTKRGLSSSSDKLNASNGKGKANFQDTSITKKGGAGEGRSK